MSTVNHASKNQRIASFTIPLVVTHSQSGRSIFCDPETQFPLTPQEGLAVLESLEKVVTYLPSLRAYYGQGAISAVAAPAAITPVPAAPAPVQNVPGAGPMVRTGGVQITGDATPDVASLLQTGAPNAQDTPPTRSEQQRAYIMQEAPVRFTIQESQQHFCALLDKVFEQPHLIANTPQFRLPDGTTEEERKNLVVAHYSDNNELEIEVTFVNRFLAQQYNIKRGEASVLRYRWILDGFLVRPELLPHYSGIKRTFFPGDMRHSLVVSSRGMEVYQKYRNDQNAVVAQSVSAPATLDTLYA